MNFSTSISIAQESVCYFYTRKDKNKRMSGGARCAQPGIPPTATNQNRLHYFTYGGNRTMNKIPKGLTKREIEVYKNLPYYFPEKH